MGHAERVNPFGRKSDVTLPVEALDRYGRALQPGDLVQAPSPNELAWKVLGVSAELDPHAPPNHVRLELQATRRVVIPTRKVLLDVVRVRTAEEVGAPASERQFFPPRVAWWRRWLGLA